MRVLSAKLRGLLAKSRLQPAKSSSTCYIGLATCEKDGFPYEIRVLVAILTTLVAKLGTLLAILTTLVAISNRLFAK